MMTRSDDEDGVLCKTPSPRSSASQAPPNPRHNPDEPPPRVNLYTSMPTQPSHPFRGLSRKFLSKKENDHKRGRSVDIGRPVGVYDTPNVRERVKRWQQSGGGVALHGDIVELPPISPATPTPGSRRGMPPAPLMPGFEMSLSGLASTMGSDAHAPLEPPRMPAIQQDWSSASEGEREAERNRTRSKERERKLRRKQRQNSEDINDRPGTAGSGYDTATPRYQANSPVVYEDDGIRISAIRKSSGSKRRRREKKEFDETDDGGVGLLTDGERSRDIVFQSERPTQNTLAAPVESSQPKQTLSEKNSHHTLEFDDGIRITPMKSKRKSKPRSESASFEVEVEFPDTEPESSRKTSESKSAKSSDYVKLNTWDNGDGIRIYANKSPVKFTDRKRSVRQSVKSVRSRREQFEADLNKEKHQQKTIEESVRAHEGDDEDDGPISAPKNYRRAEDPSYDHYQYGTSPHLQKSKSTRKKRSDERLRINTQIMGGSVGSNGIVELPKPAKFTESAPATPTGGRLRELESYNEAYNSPFSSKALDDLQSGLEEMISRSPSLRKLRDLSPPRYIAESVISSSQVSSQRARTKYSPTSDRGERRAERRELRRKLREDSEKFQTFDIRSRSESPAPQRREAEKYPVPKQLAEYYVETVPVEQPPIERAPVDRILVERVVTERAPVQQAPIVIQPPVQKSMPIVKPIPERITPISKPQEEKTVPTAKQPLEKISVAKASIEKAPEAKPKVEEQPVTREKSLVKERTVSKEKLPPKQAPKTRPVSEYSVVRDIMFPPPRHRSTMKEPISVQARARLFEQAQEPTQTPSHKKSSSLSMSSSVDDIGVKREKLHASSFSSDKPAYPKSALKSKEAPTVTRRRSRSTPPDSRILRRGSFSKILDSFDAPVQKKEPNLVPKLTSATNTFFKAIKDGFKGESVRSIGIVSTTPHSAKDDHQSLTESTIDSELQSRDTEEELSTVEEAPKKKKTVGFIEVEHSSTEEDEESDSVASSDSESNAGVSDKDIERESELLSEEGSLHSDDDGDISKDSIEPPVDLPVVEPLRITPRGSPVPEFKAMYTEAAKPLTEIPIISPSEPLVISSFDKVTHDPTKPSSDTPVTKTLEEPSKQLSSVTSAPEPTASRKISPTEPPKLSPKDSGMQAPTLPHKPLTISPLKTKVVEPLKTPIKKAAMGTVEEPPKRSVKDLVRQLESKPDKTAKVPPPEPLLDFIKEPVRLSDESPKPGDHDKSSSELSRDKPIQPLQKTEEVQTEPTKEALVKSTQPSKIQGSVDTSSSGDINEAAESADESVLSAESIPATVEKPAHHISPDVSKKELPGESSTVQNEEKIERTTTEEIVREIVQETAPKLSENPLLPFPKRSLRGTTAPPRPKSIRSDGTLSPPGSICGESIDGEPFGRSISDASMVKPLQFKKAVKPATGDTASPVSPTKEAGTQDWFNPNVPVKESSLKRRYTKHADLMSILSASKSARTASRSRRNRGPKRVETLSVDDLLRGFAYEEFKYLRELRTLVEDVVPILFQTVLGRADDDLRRSSSISSVGTSHTGSTRSSRAFSSNPTRPIVDMGISLERLRTLHERIPTGNVEQVLAWAVDARRVYEEYLSVWRLGFQDVVVHMIPDEEDYAQARRDSMIRKELEILHAGGTGSLQFEGDPSTWAMPPPPAMDDELKDEKVDVAFLLKRPLVRLKLLAKLFKVSDVFFCEFDICVFQLWHMQLRVCQAACCRSV
ncbi:hypothetical protein BZA77DRAFT_139846 [Pyronema omphalodes]|nr:hypothetical protein BZA77DRAFT_139846 [Pyronema omphalodes]